jgi:phosphoribosylformylglycinamidine synthase subunit PurL
VSEPPVPPVPSDGGLPPGGTVPPVPPVPLHRALGLTDEELVAIEARLGRTPNDLELAMFSVMWSEHCSYKSSRPLLRTLPTGGDDVVAGPGENAGVQRIGDGLAVAFKIESHNHPSAVEPYQGAATGVGGILRDIFAMGARPIAVLDALRFGDPGDPRTRHLVDGVVAGVGGYGNCVGVPTVGGELVFDPSYQGNPLVNVMAIGILREDAIMRAAAPGPGNLVVLYGSTTGRDGIGGASVLASATFGDQDPSKRPAVQVGDPFAEKLLIEATLEIIGRGLAEGIQDLGAAGITCGVSETADRAGTGIVVDLDAIPRREPGMAPFEVLISESQERMVAIARPERFPEIAAICARWGLPCAVIGRVTDDGDVTVVEGGLDAQGRPLPGARELARVPAPALASDAIVIERLAAPPPRRRAAPAPGLPPGPSELLPERGMDPGAVLLGLLGSPNLSSRRWVYEQYDHHVQTNTVAGPGRGAAVLRVKGTRRALVASTDGNQAVSALDPYLGAALSVAEATRNVSVTGARPLGVTNCLNFGDPTRPEAFWQLSEAVRGLGDACRALGIPVTGGNVSLYNEAPGGAIAPTPEIGVVGLADEVDLLVGPALAVDGAAVLLAGTAGPGLGGSAYAALAGGGDDDPPTLDLRREAALQAFLREAVLARLVLAAQDVSGGGLAVTLAEMATWGGRGGRYRVAVAGSPAVALFGESPSRAVVAASPADVGALVALAAGNGVPLTELGASGGDRLVIELAGEGATGAAEERGAGVADAVDLALADLRHALEQGLPRALGAGD